MDKGHVFQSKLIKLLVIILVFFIILAVTILIFFSRIVTSVNDSDVIPLIKNHRQEKQQVQKEILLSLYFPIVSVVDSSYRYTKTSVMIKNDEYLAHHFIEHLLKGVPQGALIEGALSFIPSNTTLIGYTVSKNIGYIHLSDEFLQHSEFEENFDVRIDQLRKNMKENFSLLDVVIIVNDAIVVE